MQQAIIGTDNKFRQYLEAQSLHLPLELRSNVLHINLLLISNTTLLDIISGSMEWSDILIFSKILHLFDMHTLHITVIDTFVRYAHL